MNIKNGTHGKSFSQYDRDIPTTKSFFIDCEGARHLSDDQDPYWNVVYGHAMNCSSKMDPNRARMADAPCGSNTRELHLEHGKELARLLKMEDENRLACRILREMNESRRHHESYD